MKTGILGQALIKESELLALKAYIRKGDKWTIGWGNIYIDGRPVRQGDVIDIAKAQDMFDEGLLEREKQLISALKVVLNQNQFDALMDFLWEFGSGQLAQSHLLAKINVDPTDETIPSEFRKWVKGKDGNGNLITLPGMVTRREKEIALYYKPVTLIPQTTQN